MDNVILLGGVVVISGAIGLPALVHQAVERVVERHRRGESYRLACVVTLAPTAFVFTAFVALLALLWTNHLP